LSVVEVRRALEAGAGCARRLLATGLIDGAALRLNGEVVMVAARATGMPGVRTPDRSRASESAMHV
jgi:hypothetical protein